MLKRGSFTFGHALDGCGDNSLKISHCAMYKKNLFPSLHVYFSCCFTIVRAARILCAAKPSRAQHTDDAAAVRHQKPICRICYRPGTGSKHNHTPRGSGVVDVVCSIQRSFLRGSPCCAVLSVQYHSAERPRQTERAAGVVTRRRYECATGRTLFYKKILSKPSRLEAFYLFIYLHNYVRYRAASFDFVRFVCPNLEMLSLWVLVLLKEDHTTRSFRLMQSLLWVSLSQLTSISNLGPAV